MCNPLPCGEELKEKKAFSSYVSHYVSCMLSFTFLCRFNKTRSFFNLESFSKKSKQNWKERKMEKNPHFILCLNLKKKKTGDKKKVIKQVILTCQDVRGEK